MKRRTKTNARVKAVRKLLKEHPTRVIWTQKSLAHHLARELNDTSDPRFLARYRGWVKTTGRRRLADCLLKDPVSGWVQGFADPERLAACLPTSEAAAAPATSD